MNVQKAKKKDNKFSGWSTIQTWLACSPTSPNIGYQVYDQLLLLASYL